MYFLTLFACCREAPNFRKTRELIGLTGLWDGVKGDGHSLREDNGKFTDSLASNCLFLYGCNSSEGVNTDFVKSFVEHVSSQFDPDQRSVIIPDCLGANDAGGEMISVKLTSGHLDRKLNL